MNVYTISCLVCWVIGWIIHSVNLLICTRKFLKIQRGQLPPKPFFTKKRWIQFWCATVDICLSTLLFVAFFEVSLIDKIKMLTFIVVTIPIQPLAVMCIVGYIVMLRNNRVVDQ